MNSNASSSSQDQKETNLPSGPKPTFFITNKEPRVLSDDELKTMGKKVLEKICCKDKRLSAICIRGYDEECPFCKSMNSQFQTKDDSTPKLFHKGPYVFDSSGFRGCEQNNLIIHFDYTYGYNPCFECFSRARQNLIVMIGKTYLERNRTLPNTIKEILTHGQKCENERCKENGLDQLKVVDVEFIGFTEDEVRKLKNEPDSNSAKFDHSSLRPDSRGRDSRKKKCHIM